MEYAHALLHLISRTSLSHVNCLCTGDGQILVARRKLELFAVEAADAMLADVLQQLPLLTVCDTIPCGTCHRNTHVHAQMLDACAAV